MRKVSIAMAAVVTAALLLVLASFPQLVASEQRVSLDPAKLVHPVASLTEEADTSLPGSSTSVNPGYSMKLGWTMTGGVYANYGGALDLTVTNTHASTTLFIYSMGLQWNGGPSYSRDCSVIIDPGQQTEVGQLLFGAPENAGSTYYKIVLKMAASSDISEWYDLGIVYRDALNPVNIQPMESPRQYSVQSNVDSYYAQVNEFIDIGAVAPIVSEIRERQPGDYSILQIAEAYHWMKNHIAYRTDTGVDDWQKPPQTIELGTGDCEDQAFLLASIIKGLGGDARVIIIGGHAFPVVFVASDVEELADVRASLASYYHMDSSEFRMAYLADDLGYWLVIDSTGFPYAGGLPAKSAPTDAGGGWTVLSDFMYVIDAVGAADRSFWIF